MGHSHDKWAGGAEWPFPGPENHAVVCCPHVLDRSRPILRVTHDEDDEGWQFLCGEAHENDAPCVVCLGCMVNRDRALHQLADLPLGWCADRDTDDAPWERSRNSAVEK
jgi:hypothetical protein